VGVPAEVKTGVKIRQQEMGRWNWSTQWTSPELKVAQFEDKAFNFAPFDGRYARRPFLSVDRIVEHKKDNPNLWTENLALKTQNMLTGRQDLSERVSSAYVQGSSRIAKLHLLGGVRVERTDVKGEGSLQQVTPEERARRAAWVGAVTPDEAVRRVQAEFGQRRTAESDYVDVLPGIHFNYHFNRHAIARASFTTGLARPDPGNLMPLDLVNDEAQTVRFNNTELSPQRGQNFDLSLEYYFEPAGLISVGAFYKEIDQFIYNATGQVIGSGQDNGFNGQYVGYTLTSQRNGGFAKVKGLEASYQQQFNFLPGWLKGFGAFANYTKLETEGDYGVIGDVRSSASIPGFVPEAANAGISYIKGKISLRLHYGYNSERLIAFNANPDLRRWELESHRLDLKAKYFWRRALSFYADVYNLTKNNQRERFGSQVARFLQDRYDPQLHFGIEGRF
jgi:iron complex outermembrane receptor protein